MKNSLIIAIVLVLALFSFGCTAETGVHTNQVQDNSFAAVEPIIMENTAEISYQYCYERIDLLESS
ncbi:MAG: hypothetical protein ACMXYK_00795 [Candidatus Woesearchaeota archaeon]